MKLPYKNCTACKGTGSVVNYAKAGPKFRALREENNLTLRAVAERMGIHFTYLAGVERGRYSFTEAQRKAFTFAVVKLSRSKKNARSNQKHSTR